MCEPRRFVITRPGRPARAETAIRSRSHETRFRSYPGLGFGVRGRLVAVCHQRAVVQRERVARTRCLWLADAWEWRHPEFLQVGPIMAGSSDSCGSHSELLREQVTAVRQPGRPWRSLRFRTRCASTDAGVPGRGHGGGRVRSRPRIGARTDPVGAAALGDSVRHPSERRFGAAYGLVVGRARDLW